MLRGDLKCLQSSNVVLRLQVAGFEGSAQPGSGGGGDRGGGTTDLSASPGDVQRSADSAQVYGGTRGEASPLADSRRALYM